MADTFLEWFGQYVILEPLGRGGMGRVDLAMTASGDEERLVVLKRLHADGDAEAAAALRDEAKLSARFTHPNLARSLGTEESGTELAIVMEYVEGHALVELVRTHEKRGSRVPIAVSIRIVSDILIALEWAHSLRGEDGRTLNLVHRDVTPHNVFLTYGGAAKLLDFGLAKVANVASRTGTGLVKGKIGYMAPEQLRGEPIKPCVDVFAAGVILWELLASRRLLRGASANWEYASGAVRSLPSVRDFVGIDEELAAIVARAIAWSPEDRFPKAADLRLALNEYASANDYLASPGDVARHLGSVLGGVHDDRRERILERYMFVHCALREDRAHATILPPCERPSDAPVTSESRPERPRARSWTQAWSLAVAAGLCALGLGQTDYTPGVAAAGSGALSRVHGTQSRVHKDKRVIGEPRYQALLLSATKTETDQRAAGPDRPIAR